MSLATLACVVDHRVVLKTELRAACVAFKLVSVMRNVLPRCAATLQTVLKGRIDCKILLQGEVEVAAVRNQS